MPLSPSRQQLLLVDDEEDALLELAELPVIVISGHADMDDVSDLLRLQVLDLFRKPIYHVRLLDTLENLFPQPTHLHLART